MSQDEKKKVEIKIRKEGSHDAEEVAEILGVVSEKIPALIKGLMASVFSPDAAANMGKAAAEYYKQLKAGGIPDDVAVVMTQDYVGTFTKMGDLFKSMGQRAGKGEDMDQEIKKAILEKVKRKLETED